MSIGPVDYKVLRMVPAAVARAYKIFPVAYDEVTQEITIAIVGSVDPTVLEALPEWLSCKVRTVVYPDQDVLEAVAQSYGHFTDDCVCSCPRCRIIGGTPESADGSM